MFDQLRVPLGGRHSGASLGIFNMASGVFYLVGELVDTRPASWIRLSVAIGMLLSGAAVFWHARRVQRLVRSEDPWVEEARRRLARNDKGGAVTTVCDATGVSRADALYIIESWRP